MIRMKQPYAGSEWISANAKTGSRPLSALGINVADALGFVYRGIYHLPMGVLVSADWSNGRTVAVSVPADLCTWDGNELTRLVVVCHDLMLRMEVSPVGPYYLRLTFFQRRTRVGSIVDRLPTIEEHISMIRGYEILETVDP